MSSKLAPALLLLLGACAPARFEPAAIWLPESDPLYSAQQAWGLPLRSVPVLHVDLTAAELPAACAEPWKERLEACSFVVEAQIWVASDIAPARAEMARRHELGHVLGGWRHYGHLPAELCSDGEQHLMCSGGSASGEPTPEDFDLVLGM